MTPFRRRRGRSGEGRYAADAGRFWSWWDGARDRIGGAVDDGDLSAVRALIEPRLREIHPDLTWTAGTGVQAAHMLVVTGNRHPGLRSVTERWRRAGPADDARWEYHPAAPAEPYAFSARVVVGGLEIDPGHAVALVTTDDQRCRLNLSVHHPAFSQLGAAASRRVCDVLVTWALGEDDVDRWIGLISPAETEPLDSVPMAMLSAVTAQLPSRWGGERWSMLEGSFGKRRLIATVRHPLHRVDHPLLDEHLAVRLPYADMLPDGLPGPHALAELQTFEDIVVSRLGGDALLVAQQTSSGERLLHLYADSASSPVGAVRQLLSTYLSALATLTAEFDPGWQSIEHLRS
jgi:hypothetical protein